MEISASLREPLRELVHQPVDPGQRGAGRDRENGPLNGVPGAQAKAEIVGFLEQCKRFDDRLQFRHLLPAMEVHQIRRDGPLDPADGRG